MSSALRTLAGEWIPPAPVATGPVSIASQGFFAPVATTLVKVPGQEATVAVVSPVPARPQGYLPVGMGFGQARGVRSTIGVQTAPWMGQGPRVRLPGQRPRSTYSIAMGEQPKWFQVAGLRMGGPLFSPRSADYAEAEGRSPTTRSGFGRQIGFKLRAPP